MTTVTESSLRSITSSNRARRSSVTSGSRAAIAVSGSTPRSIVGAGPKISSARRTPADRRRIRRSGHGLAHDIDDADHVAIMSSNMGKVRACGPSESALAGLG